MAQNRIIACSLLIEESFGELVGGVATYLLKNSGNKLANITKSLKLKKTDVVKSLCILIHHNLVKYSVSKPGAVLYRIDASDVLERTMYPSYLLIAREVAGTIGELIVEDLVINGLSSMSECIARVVEKLINDKVSEKKLIEDIKKQFECLVEAHLLQRMDTSTTNAELGITIHCQSEQQFLLPPQLGVPQVLSSRKRERESEQDRELPATKKRKSQGVKDELPVPDANIMWFMNTKQFHCCYRNKCLVDSVHEKLDPIATNIMRIILMLSIQDEKKDLLASVGPPIYLLRVKDSLPSTLSLSDEDLVQYMKVLTEEQFIMKNGDEGGGSYSVKFKTAAELLCMALLELVIRERFDSKHLRLFRLLVLKKYLEQKEIISMALISHKEANKMLYSLLAEQYVTLQEIPRSSDYAPSKTFYLFSVQIDSVARIVLQRCYKALANLMVRRKHETTENKRLLEKYMLWERQVISLEDDEMDTMNPSEKESAETVKKKVAKIEQAELQLTTSIRCLEDYLQFVSDK